MANTEGSVEGLMSTSGRGRKRLLELRPRHGNLHLAIRDAHGWKDLDLVDDFHEVETLPENDRVRYTISRPAREEVLCRILALNHVRVAEEAARAAGKTRKCHCKPREIGAGGGLFA